MRKRSLKFIYIEIFKPKQEDNEPIIFFPIETIFAEFRLWHLNGSAIKKKKKKVPQFTNFSWCKW